jgi:hypothetical protein
MIYLLLCLYAYVHGQSNALLYGRKGAESLPGNEHRYLVAERVLLVLAFVVGVVYGSQGWLIEMYVEVPAGILAFSFWHNGAYYVMRNRIFCYDAIQGGWKYTWSDIQFLWTLQSSTTTARVDLTFTQRLVLLLASLVLLLIGYSL